MRVLINISTDDYQEIIRDKELDKRSLTFWERKVADGVILSKDEYIPVAWLREKLTNHPEIPYSITDGINNVLDFWERNKDADSNEYR